MPRSRGRSAAPAPRQQTRSAHTMTAPQQHSAPVQPQVVQQRQPGLFSQMASTAAGVAVGSTVGHTLANGVSSIFGGGSSAQPQVDQAQVQQQQQQPLQQQGSSQCEFDARNLTQCMDQNNGDMRVCQWYMDQLKSCLGAAGNY